MKPDNSRQLLSGSTFRTCHRNRHVYPNKGISGLPAVQALGERIPKPRHLIADDAVKLFGMQQFSGIAVHRPEQSVRQRRSVR